MICRKIGPPLLKCGAWLKFTNYCFDLWYSLPVQISGATSAEIQSAVYLSTPNKDLNKRSATSYQWCPIMQTMLHHVSLKPAWSTKSLTLHVLHILIDVHHNMWNGEWLNVSYLLWVCQLNNTRPNNHCMFIIMVIKSINILFFSSHVVGSENLTFKGSALNRKSSSASDISFTMCTRIHSWGQSLAAHTQGSSCNQAFLHAQKYVKYLGLGTHQPSRWNPTCLDSTCKNILQ